MFSLKKKSNSKPLMSVVPKGQIVYQNLDGDDDSGIKYSKVKGENFSEAEIEDEKEKFMLLPESDPKQRHTIYISGPSGSGKSTWIAKYLELYKNIYPKRKVYIFSALDSDSTIDKYGKRVILDEQFVDKYNSGELGLDTFYQSVVVFDDIDVIRENETRKTVYKLLNEILQIGRHNAISVLVSNHLSSDYKKTREIINEASHFVLFCSRNSSSTNRFLKTYSGLDKGQIDRLFKLKSRWICLSVQYPQYVLYEKGVYAI